MSNLDQSTVGDRPDQPGKTRTWWHPLLAWLLGHVLATAYQVLEEVLVGKLPLRLDILLIRRNGGQLSEASRRDLGMLLWLLNRFSLVQFKGPTDALERGDPILSLVSRIFLDDRERIIEELTRTGHAPLLYYMLQQVQQFRKLGEDFAMQHKDSEYLGEVEDGLQTAVLEAIPVEKIVRHLTEEGEEELQAAVLEAIPAEKIVRHLTEERDEELQAALLEAIPAEKIPAEKIVRRLTEESDEELQAAVLEAIPAEKIVRHLSPEQLEASLTEEQAARLRELLERHRAR